jgi:tetrapyrrole methylase family protein/MazG family protein
LETIDDLFNIVRTLRGKKGCSWDRKQRPETMWKCLIEESYELQDALAKKDADNICEELGDVLFQLVFIIEIFQEKQMFHLSDVISQVAAKMVRRHPHVYQDQAKLSEQQLNDQWVAIKAGEKRKKGHKDESVLDRVPKGMPALMRALNVSKIAVKEGFDWDDIHGVLQAVRDEIDEFESALEKGDRTEMHMEFGDILFSLVNVARFARIYPENALADSTEKFDGRFRLLEKMLKKKGCSLSELDRNEIDQLWDQAKTSHTQAK